MKKYSKKNKKRIQYNKLQKGGVKVAEGSFGCVVKPNIPCRKTKKKYHHSISKIIHTKNNNEYLEELDIYKRIRLLDPKQNYLISFLEECKLHNSDLDSRHPKDILTVSIDNSDDSSYKLTGKDAKLKDLYSYDDLDKKFCKTDFDKAPRNMIQPYGGDDLSKIIKTKNTDILKLCVKKIHKITYNLLYGIYKLHSAKIIHRDIKELNILVFLKPKQKKSLTKKKNSKDKSNNLKSNNDINYSPIARHIDFGLSEDISKNINRDIYDVHYQGTPGFIPIDIVLLSKIKRYLSRKNKKYNLLKENYKNILIKQTFNEYNRNMIKRYSKLKLNKSFINLSKNSMIGKDKNSYVTLEDISELCDKYTKSVVNDKFEDIYFKKYDGIIYKTDIFALGLVFKQIINVLKVKNDKLENLVKKMCQIDPDNRPNIKECLKHPFFKI